MNEPIIDPMFFYWIQIVDGLKELMEGLGIFGTFFSLAGLVFIMVVIQGNEAWVGRWPDDKKEKEKENKFLRKISKALSVAVLFAIFVGISSVFVPTKQTLIEMQVAKQVTPHNLNVAGDAVDKTVDSIFEKVDKYLDKTKGE